MSTPTSAPTFSLLTSIITNPEHVTTYNTTYVVESPLPASPGSTSLSTWTTTRPWTTTIPSTTITSLILVPIITPFASFTTPSTLVTLTTGSSTTSGTATTSSVHPIDTTTTLPSGVTAIQKPNSSKTTAIAVGVTVPLTIVGIGLIVFVLWRWKKNERALNRAVGPFVIKHWWEYPQSESSKPAIIPPPPPLPPLPSVPTAAGTELEGERSPFRVASPPRPRRPGSISESILNAMGENSSPGSLVGEVASDHGETGIELAHLRSPRSFSDDDDMTPIPNTDNTPVYDGTRKKYLRTALERNLPLSQLTRPSLRIANAPPPTQQDNCARRSSYFPQPLRINKQPASDTNGPSGHQRSASDTKGPSIRSRYVTNLENNESAYSSPVPTQQEFVEKVRGNLLSVSKAPPLERAAEKNVELMDDASDEGSNIQDSLIERQREESLASLEGRTPKITSYGFGLATGRPELRDAFGRPIPPLTRAPLPGDQRAAHRKANVIDEGKINEWV